jgi:hypothetical protein
LDASSIGRVDFDVPSRRGSHDFSKADTLKWPMIFDSICVVAVVALRQLTAA